MFLEMKNKINIKKVRFICDKCEKKSGFRQEIDSDEYKGESPFLYRLGWIYIYNLCIKVLEKQITIKDKHFCCRGCFCNYIDSLINETYEESKVRKIKRRKATRRVIRRRDSASIIRRK